MNRFIKKLTQWCWSVLLFYGIAVSICAQTITKSESETTGTVGDAVTYVMQITNNSPGPITCGPYTFETDTVGNYPANWSAGPYGTGDCGNNNPTFDEGVTNSIGGDSGHVFEISSTNTGYLACFATYNCPGDQLVDGTMCADVYVASGRAELLWRQNGASDYQVSLGSGAIETPAGHDLEIRVTTNGNYVPLGGVNLSTPFTYNTWYHVCMAVNGFTITATVNSETMPGPVIGGQLASFSETDTNSSFPAGNSGLQSSYGNASAFFDNVIVTTTATNYLNTTVTDTLPTGLTYSSCSGAGGLCGDGGGIVNWNTGEVDAGDSESVTLVGTINSCISNIINQASWNIGLPQTMVNSNAVTDTLVCSPTPTPACGVQFVTEVNGLSASMNPSFNINSSGNNTFLVVQVWDSNVAVNVTGTDNGNAMTQYNRAGYSCDGLSGFLDTLVYVNPPAGPNAVNLSSAAAGTIYYGAMIYQGVNQTTPIGSTYQGIPCLSSTNQNYNISTVAADSLIASMILAQNAPAVTSGAGQTKRYTETDGTNFTIVGDDKTTTSTGSYNMSYTLAPAEYAAYQGVEIEAASCFTSTFTNTPTATSTCTPTNSPTVTMTNTVTNTPSNTPTFTFSNTMTNTATNTATVTSTNTPTNTATNTVTVTSTNTPTTTGTNTSTFTSTNTATDTLVFTATYTNTSTDTATVTSTNTTTNTPTDTASSTSTDTSTVTMTNTPTDTFIFTATATTTNTSTDTATATGTNTITETVTNTATPTSTNTITNTSTATAMNTPTNTMTSTVTNTSTNTETMTDTMTSTNTPANTSTNTQTNTPTHTPTSTATSTPTPTPVSQVTMVKQASEATAHAGDTLTYSIGITVTGNTASNMVVTDVMPAGLTFVGFGTTAPTGTVESQNQQSLKWTLPSPLAIGTYQLTYQALVNNFVAGGTITNNAQLTDTALLSPIVSSVNLQILGLFTVSINIYNSAGEVVKTISVKQYSEPINSISLQSSNMITTLQGPDSSILIYFNGNLIGTWDGTNNSNNPVTNGNYLIKVQNAGPTDSVTSVAQEIIVNRKLSDITADIYNSAGELVRSLYNVVNDANDVEMTNVNLSSNVFNPGDVANGSVTNLQIWISTSGTPVTLTWDGTNNVGTVVTPGSYTIHLHWNNGQGETTDISRTVLVTAGGGASGVVIAKPNVLTPSQTMTTMFDGTAIANALSLNVKIYTIAGELVQTITGQTGAATAMWTATGIASGIYIAVVEVQGATGGIIIRQTLKILVLH